MGLTNDVERTVAVIYAAKSSPDERGSIASQVEECRAYAARQGWEVDDDPHTDEAVSGFRSSRGTGLAAAKSRAAELAVEGSKVVLLVFAFDRLARGDGRSAAHLVEHHFDALKAGYRLVSVTEPFNEETGLAMLALLGDRGHMDSKAKSEHVKRGKRAWAQRGRRNGGPRPFGYTHEIVGVDERTRRPTTRLSVVPAEAATVRRIFREYLEGQAQAAIARGLARDEIKTTRGGAWNQSQVSALLRSRLYVGEVQYYGEWFPGQHDPIVDVDVFDAVQRVLRGVPRDRGGRRAAEPFLLGRGMLKCGSCGSSMRVRSEPSRNTEWRAFYRCTGREGGAAPECRMPGIPRDRVDPYVYAHFEDVALDVDAMREHVAERFAAKTDEIKSQLEHATREEATARARLTHVRTVFQDGKLDPDDYREQRDDLRDGLRAATAAAERLQARLAELKAEAAHVDAEEEALTRLAAFREAVAGNVRDAQSVEAAHNALKTVFSHFVLHHRRAIAAAATGETDEADEADEAAMKAEDAAERAKLRVPIYEADLDLGSYYLEPIPRDEAIVVPWAFDSGDVSVFEELRRTTIAATGEPNESSSRPAGSTPDRAPSLPHARR
jgi:site-specific DNA recombinase